MRKHLEGGLPMEGEEPSRKGVMKSIRSRPFYVLLSGYPGIFQGPRSRLGEAEDEEETEVPAALYNYPESNDASNIALHNKPIVSQAEPTFLKMME
ncbi:hypothetical protein O181_013705 [Austropuccinia psidii MF-1]|uniref:Uncharacterized protein n=1 Tax=Austropuccinia psidii MF-1 TaxID=1389203 RepID=A0A9Q3BZJ5_9BASI|nr:hypothetical protein [Austropuccinia psidii MF-1]